MTNETSDATESVDPTVAGLIVGLDACIYYRGTMIPLSPKEQGALTLLLEHWPASVSKDEFAAAVWPDSTMSDESLARCITQLRRSTAQVDGLQIEALYGRGYRLIISVPAAPQKGRHEGAVHDRLLDAANYPPYLVETFLYTRNLIEQRTVHSLIQAESALRAAIADAPDYMPARLAFAECATSQINCGASIDPALLDEALDLLEPVHTEDTARGALWSQMAHVRDTRWHFHAARAQHEQAVLIAPDDATIRFNFGWHLFAVGKPDEALKQFERAYKLNPFSPVISIMLARAAAGADDIPTAFHYSRRAYAAHPDSPQAYLYLLSLEAFARPRAELARAARHFGLHKARWTFGPSTLSYIFARCGDRKQALDVIEHTKKENVCIQATHSGALLALGMADDALRAVRASSEIGCGFLPVMINSPENDALRSHVGYRAVYGRVFAELKE